MSAPRVAFLGPAGTFSDDALRTAARGSEHEPVSGATIHDAIAMVQRGEADRALVPFENSIEGSVRPTLDALAFESDGGRRSSASTTTRSGPALIARERIALASDQRGRQPPTADRPVRPVPPRELPGATRAGDRAARPRRFARCGRASAAGRPRRGLGGGALRLRRPARGDPGRGRERHPVRLDRPPRARSRRAMAPWRTTLTFSELGADHPGALVDALTEFSGRAVNLTRIESRPLRQGLGRYMFFIDLEGAATTCRRRIDRGASRQGRERAAAGQLSGRDAMASREPARFIVDRPRWSSRIPLALESAGRSRRRAVGGATWSRSTTCRASDEGCGRAGRDRRAASWSSTPATSRSTSARCAARPSCCSRTGRAARTRATASLRSELLSLERPCVIRLVNYVRIPRDVHRRKITRKAVLARDAYTCQYCGTASRRPDGRPRDPAQPRRRLRPGRTSSPPARPATARRATGCPARRRCPCGRTPRRPGPTSSSGSPARACPTPGSSTYWRPDRPLNARRAARRRPFAHACDCEACRDWMANGTSFRLLRAPVPGLDSTRRPALPS